MQKLFAKPVIEIRTKTLLERSTKLKAKAGRAPHLSVVLVGEDPASEVYVGKKGKAAEEVGFTHETIVFPKDVAPALVKKKIDELNASPTVDGILIQRPLPAQFNEKEAIFWVAPEKDVDCLHPENIGLLVRSSLFALYARRHTDSARALPDFSREKGRVCHWSKCNCWKTTCGAFTFSKCDSDSSSSCDAKS